MRAPLADPTATPDADSIPAVDAALRHVVHALLVGVDTVQLGETALQVAPAGGSGMPAGTYPVFDVIPHSFFEPMSYRIGVK